MVGFGRFFCAGGKVENDGELFKQISQVVGYNPGSNPSIRQLTQEATVVEVGSFKGSPGNSINALKGLLALRNQTYPKNPDRSYGNTRPS